MSERVKVIAKVWDQPVIAFVRLIESRVGIESNFYLDPEESFDGTADFDVIWVAEFKNKVSLVIRIAIPSMTDVKDIKNYYMDKIPIRVEVNDRIICKGCGPEELSHYFDQTCEALLSSLE